MFLFGLVLFILKINSDKKCRKKIKIIRSKLTNHTLCGIQCVNPMRESNAYKDFNSHRIHVWILLFLFQFLWCGISARDRTFVYYLICSNFCSYTQWINKLMTENGFFYCILKASMTKRELNLMYKLFRV